MAALMAAPAAAPMPGTFDLETGLLLEALYQRFGHDFRTHDRPTVQRKLRVLIDTGLRATVSMLQHQLLHEAGVADELVRALAAAPAGLFDDPAFGRELRTVLAGLHAAAVPKIWLAECTSAFEAWALAIVLADEQLAARTEVFATCADEGRMQEMRDATVPEASLIQWQAHYLQAGGTGTLSRHFDIENSRVRLRAGLRDRVTWAAHSLVTDASFNEFEVILCSRALPDFGPAMRQRALRVFHDSLARFGVLAIDRQMTPADAHAASYQAIGAERHWYKRVA